MANGFHPSIPPSGKPKLLDQVRHEIRVRHMALSTERLYVNWIRRFIVQDSKGKQDRFTMLPRSVVTPLQEHPKHVRAAHERAMREGYGGVELPFALARKYPRAAYEWGWQYVFPAPRPSVDPRSGVRRRHHLDGLRPRREAGGAESRDPQTRHGPHVSPLVCHATPGKGP